MSTKKHNINKKRKERGEERRQTDDGGSDVELSLPVSVKANIPEATDGVLDGDLDVLAGAGVLVVVVLGCGIGAGVDVDVNVSVLARLLDVHTEAGGGGRDVDVEVLPLKSVERSVDHLSRLEEDVSYRCCFIVLFVGRP